MNRRDTRDASHGATDRAVHRAAQLGHKIGRALHVALLIGAWLAVAAIAGPIIVDRLAYLIGAFS